MIEQISKIYGETHPGVTIRSISFPTEQWFSKTIAAVNTNTAPDIIFNDDSRIVTIQQRTGKVSDLRTEIDSLPAGDRKAITEGDLTAASFEGRVLMVPFQRVIQGWGVRKSWMEKAGKSFPQTWEETLSLARTMQATDPDANGKADTYGMAWQAGNAGSMIGAGINLLVYGSGQAHPIIDVNGNIVIDQPAVAKPTIEYLKLFTEYKLVAPDTINHTFTDMYQLIEGGRVGMFRVGNWNVKKWDTETIKGDYVVGPYPSFGNGQGAMVVGSVRGMAVPTNAPNAAAAKEFVKFIVSQQAQQRSLENMGGVVRTDLDTKGLTPSLRPFVDPSTRLVTNDFMSAKFPWFLELQEAYYKKLIGAVSNPPKDWDAFIKQTATELRAEVDRLQKKG